MPPGLSDVKIIFSTCCAFAALKEDSTVVAWGDSDYGGSVPVGLSGVKTIFSTERAFAALKEDSTVVAWGKFMGNSRGQDVPADLIGVKTIYSTERAFAALKKDGTVRAWGHAANGGQEPAGLRNIKSLYSTRYSFIALSNDGKVVAGWGGANYQYEGNNVPAGLSGVKTIYSNFKAFAALKEDSTVVAWGYYMGNNGGSNVPEGLSGVKAIYSTASAFAALKDDGTVAVWGSLAYGGTAPAQGLSGGVASIYGFTKYTGISIYPDSYALMDDSFPFPTSQPTAGPSSEPTTQPSSHPSSQPSSRPSSNPSMHPTSKPTSQPSSYPTFSPTSLPTLALSEPLEIEQGLPLNKTALLAGAGINFAARTTVTNLGSSEFAQYYISIFVYDTGFGPASSGQYVKFKVNGRLIRVAEGNATLDGCAPMKSEDEMKCSNHFKSCKFNEKVDLLPEHGGSLLLEAESHGVMTSPCAYKNYALYVKYVLSKNVAQHTPNPTLAPTAAPTKVTKIVNGLDLNVSSLDIWKLLQISIGVGVALAAGAVYLCKLRSRCYPRASRISLYSALYISV